MVKEPAYRSKSRRDGRKAEKKELKKKNGKKKKNLHLGRVLTPVVYGVSVLCGTSMILVL